MVYYHGHDIFTSCSLDTLVREKVNLIANRNTRYLHKQRPVPSLAFKLNLALRRGSNSNPIEIGATSRILALNMGLAIVRTVAFPGKKSVLFY